MSASLEAAKKAIWHVEKVGERFLVSKGEVSLGVWFTDYNLAVENAGGRNIMERLMLDPQTLQGLIEDAELLGQVRRRSATMANRYRDHPAFQSDNTGEDIFSKYLPWAIAFDLAITIHVFASMPLAAPWAIAWPMLQPASRV